MVLDTNIEHAYVLAEELEHVLEPDLGIIRQLVQSFDGSWFPHRRQYPPIQKKRDCSYLITVELKIENHPMK